MPFISLTRLQGIACYGGVDNSIVTIGSNFLVIIIYSLTIWVRLDVFLFLINNDKFVCYTFPYIRCKKLIYWFSEYFLFLQNAA